MSKPMSRQHALPLSRLLLLAATLFACVACSSTLTRLPAPRERLSEAKPIDFDIPVRLVESSTQVFRERSVQLLDRIQQTAPDHVVNVLALSGGGAGGAFGAGALIGLSRSGKRPDFQIVTGVSVGALIAPLAFLGPDGDPALRLALSGESSTSLLQRNLFGVLFGGISVYRGKPLHDLVDRFVTDDLITAVAREYARGRMLYIETTDLDKGEPVVWDMGAIAQRGGKPARKLFREVLIASASIPVVFPPVLIRVQKNGKTYDELHVDGATTQPIFLAPSVAALLSETIPRTYHINVYAIVNGQLDHLPATVPLKLAPLLSTAFNTNLDQNSRSALALAFNVAQRYGMNFQVAAIPDRYPFGGSLDFDSKHMNKLFDYAAGCAASGSLWTTIQQIYQDATRDTPPSTTADHTACPADATIGDTPLAPLNNTGH